METGIELIARERAEQIDKHERTVKRDVMENGTGQLPAGAVALITANHNEFSQTWDKSICDKMASKSYVERLTIAGALIAAEIDRVNYVRQ